MCYFLYTFEISIKTHSENHRMHLLKQKFSCVIHPEVPMFTHMEKK